MSKYRCSHCGKTMKRGGTKVWLTSLCMITGQMARLYRITPKLKCESPPSKNNSPAS